MGVAAENVAAHYRISRERQDAFALQSHSRALEAAKAGFFEAELVPLPNAGGTIRADTLSTVGTINADDGPRPRLTAGVLARFPPAFSTPGTVTAGNSCFDADGAAAVVITSLQRARELGARDGLMVLGTDTAGVDPELLGIGAASAAARLLATQGITAQDVDLVEFNEAFASQTLACLDLLNLDPGQVNRDGGALALGHAYGSSGAVLVTRLLAQARRNPQQERLALAMISIAGGMGTAALFRYEAIT
jgi:acetyl-CoA C-acetyltransferase